MICVEVSSRKTVSRAKGEGPDCAIKGMGVLGFRRNNFTISFRCGINMPPEWKCKGDAAHHGIRPPNLQHR